jgi:hypothetical protein
MDSVIQFRGTIYENGYGLIARKVMRDKRLPKQSKLIYAYMCSYAGTDENGNRSAFPSVSLQCDELGMNQDTYYRWRKYLVDYGYITIEKQRNEQSRFDRNLYIIEAIPVEKIEETEPIPKNSGMDPHPKNSGMVKRSTIKKGTINNSSISNSFKNLEEEEEVITLECVTSFMNKQISKREITNEKTITAIMEVVEKCKAIGTTDIEAMQNYCIKVVEDKMSKFGQKQKATGSAKKIQKPHSVEEKLMDKVEWLERMVEIRDTKGAVDKMSTEEKEEYFKKAEELKKQLDELDNDGKVHREENEDMFENLRV